MPEIHVWLWKGMKIAKKAHRKRGGFQFSELWWVPAFDGTDTTRGHPTSIHIYYKM